MRIMTKTQVFVVAVLSALGLLVTILGFSLLTSGPSTEEIAQMTDCAELAEVAQDTSDAEHALTAAVRMDSLGCLPPSMYGE
jgi:hypothetical protein